MAKTSTLRKSKHFFKAYAARMEQEYALLVKDFPCLTSAVLTSKNEQILLKIYGKDFPLQNFRLVGNVYYGLEAMGFSTFCCQRFATIFDSQHLCVKCIKPTTVAPYEQAFAREVSTEKPEWLATALPKQINGLPLDALQACLVEKALLACTEKFLEFQNSFFVKAGLDAIR